MANIFKTVSPGQQPLATDVNQLVNALSGLADLGQLKIALPTTVPSVPTLASSGVSGNPNGTYKYQLVYVTGWVDSYYNLYVNGFVPSVEATLTVTTNMVNVTIPSFSKPIIGAAIYRTAAGGATGTEKFVGFTTIATGTTFVDNIADASIGTGMPTVTGGTAIPASVPTSNTTGSSLLLNNLEVDGTLSLKAMGEGGGTAYIVKENPMSGNAVVSVYIGADGINAFNPTYNNSYDYFAVKSTVGYHHFFGTDGTYIAGSKITGNGGFGNLGKTPAFTWSGTVAYGTTTTITHNLGYKPIIAAYGNTGNLQLTFGSADNNSITITDYSGGSNSWTGTVYFW